MSASLEVENHNKPTFQQLISDASILKQHGVDTELLDYYNNILFTKNQLSPHSVVEQNEDIIYNSNQIYIRNNSNKNLDNYSITFGKNIINYPIDIKRDKLCNNRINDIRECLTCSIWMSPKNHERYHGSETNQTNQLIYKLDQLVKIIEYWMDIKYPPLVKGFVGVNKINYGGGGGGGGG